MSIEMENPESLPGKIDAAWNLVEQIGLALNIGDIEHAKAAKFKATRLLLRSMEQASDQECDGPGLIRAERARQIADEGWTPEHDDEHTRGQLLDAGLSYIRAAINPGHPAMQRPPAEWPWEPSWWKPALDTKRNLVKAAALIAAELERLQRMEEKVEAGS